MPAATINRTYLILLTPWESFNYLLVEPKKAAANCLIGMGKVKHEIENYPSDLCLHFSQFFFPQAICLTERPKVWSRCSLSYLCRKQQCGKSENEQAPVTDILSLMSDEVGATVHAMSGPMTMTGRSDTSGRDLWNSTILKKKGKHFKLDKWKKRSASFIFGTWTYLVFCMKDLWCTRTCTVVYFSTDILLVNVEM